MLQYPGLGGKGVGQTGDAPPGGGLIRKTILQYDAEYHTLPGIPIGKKPEGRRLQFIGPVEFVGLFEIL